MLFFKLHISPNSLLLVACFILLGITSFAQETKSEEDLLFDMLFSEQPLTGTTTPTDSAAVKTPTPLETPIVSEPVINEPVNQPIQSEPVVSEPVVSEPVVTPDDLLLNKLAEINTDSSLSISPTPTPTPVDIIAPTPTVDIEPSIETTPTTTTSPETAPALNELDALLQTTSTPTVETPIPTQTSVTPEVPAQTNELDALLQTTTTPTVEVAPVPTETSITPEVPAQTNELDALLQTPTPTDIVSPTTTPTHIEPQVNEAIFITNNTAAPLSDRKGNVSRYVFEDPYKEELFDGIYDKYKLPTIGFAYGQLAFNGDLGKYSQQVTSLGKFNQGIKIYGEYRYQPLLNGSFSIAANLLFGSVSQYANEPYLIKNFKSSIFQFDVQGIINLDNNLVLKKQSMVVPYVAGGIGFMTFNPKTDAKDANGKSYYIWGDGIPRNIPYDVYYPKKANRLTYDYTFETPSDSAKKNPKSALVIPLSIGVKFKINDQVETKLSTTYHILSSDYVDNIKEGKKDSYLFSSVSLQYNLSGLANPKNLLYANVNFEDLEKIDVDGDGIVDFNDSCQYTPASIAVNEFGCPLDDDKDGVPNSLDEETSSAANAIVDIKGVTITEEMERERFIQDSLIFAGRRFASSDSLYVSLNKIIIDIKDINQERLRGRGLSTATDIVYLGEGERRIDLNAPTSDEFLRNNPIPTGGASSKQMPVITTESFKTIAKELPESTNKGLYYRFQIASLATPNATDYIKQKFNIDRKIYVEKTDGMYKYTIGNFSSYSDVVKVCDEFADKTKINSFVIAYRDGQRLDVWQAKKLEKGIPIDMTEEQVKEYNTSQAENNIPENSIIYRVQIASLNHDKAADFFKKKFKITEKVYVDLFNGSYKYSVGTFSSFSEAKNFSEIIKPQIGGVNSFVIAIKNGKILNLWEVNKEK